MDKVNNKEFGEVDEIEEIEENIQNDTSKKEPDIEKDVLEDEDEDIIHDLKNQIKLLQDKLLRSLADNENNRKRYEKRIEESGPYYITQFAKDLLPVIDNLSLALTHKDSDNFVSGVELTKQELTNIFKKNNIEEISPQVGEIFNYNLHNAISQVVTNEYPNGSIINVMQNGYKIRDRLLRPALVSVAKNS